MRHFREKGGYVVTVGERLKEERLLRGWSQRDLAQEAGTTAETISSIETGQHDPRPSTLRKLAEGLGIEVRDLFMEPALPKAPAREAGQPERKRPIFDLARDAVLRQGAEDRQAIARGTESGQPQISSVRHENQAMRDLLDYNKGDLAEGYVDLMKHYVWLEQEHAQLTQQIEALERRLEEVGA
jgi:transcriptional regulator with XRE-family HTH domain